MSATGQGAANGQANAAGGNGSQAQGDGAAQAGGGFDAAALQAALAPITQGQDQLRQQFQQFGQILESEPWKPQEAEAEDAGLDLSWLDGALNDPAYGEQDRQQFGQHLTGQIDERTQSLINAATAPIQQQLAEFQRQQQARDLVSEHPELQDRAIAERVVQQAQQVAQDMGQPELGNNPMFWKLIHQASRAAEAANAEAQQGGDGSPQAAHLEGGGGSGPGGGAQVDIAGSIIGAKRGASVLPFG